MNCFNKKKRYLIAATILCTVIAHTQLKGFHADDDYAGYDYAGNGSVKQGLIVYISNFVTRQKLHIGKDIEKGISDIVAAQIMRPIKFLGSNFFQGISSLAGTAQRQWYHFSENHQQLAALLPSGILTGVLGLSSYLFARRSSYWYAAGLAGGAFASGCKTGLTYFTTPVIRADTQVATTPIACRFIERFIEQLNSPNTHLVITLESHCSVGITGLDSKNQSELVRYIAQKTNMPRFIVNGQTALESPKTLEAIIARANLAASTNANLCAIVFIEHADELKTLDQNNPTIKILADGIKNSAEHAFARAQALEPRNKERERDGRYEGVVDTQEIKNAATIQTPHILFIMGLENETNLNQQITNEGFFRLMLELTTDGSGAITGKMKDPSVLTFSTLNDYKPAFDSRRLSSFEFFYREICRDKASLLTSGYDLANIPGGYPEILKPIVSTLQISVSTKKKPSFRGILLWGPPGCGKTYLARGLAGTLKAPCFTIPIARLMPTDRYGNLTTELKGYFETAQQEALKTDDGLAIIFIDECDQLLKPTDQLDPAIKPVALTLRSLLNGAEDTRYDRVITIAATNTSPDNLDAALMRTGRFDYQILLDYPDAEKRRAIITCYLHTPDIDAAEDTRSDETISVLTSHTEGFSASDLAALIQHAQMAAQHDHIQLSIDHLKKQYFLLKDQVDRRKIEVSRKTPLAPGSKLTQILEKIEHTLAKAMGTSQHKRKAPRKPRLSSWL